MQNKQIINSKLVYGYGVNDGAPTVKSIVTGKRIRCPFYRKWTGMLERCYSDKYHQKKPTYKDCYVDSKWLVFSVFKLWMQNQDWIGKELDKDILFQNNKVYSPCTCTFVSREVNLLLNKNKSIRGDYPIGVHFCKTSQSYIACVKIKGKSKYIGTYSTPSLAHEAYKSVKYKIIKSIASKQVDRRLRDALLSYTITE